MSSRSPTFKMPSLTYPCFVINCLCMDNLFPICGSSDFWDYFANRRTHNNSGLCSQLKVLLPAWWKATKHPLNLHCFVYCRRVVFKVVGNASSKWWIPGLFKWATRCWISKTKAITNMRCFRRGFFMTEMPRLLQNIRANSSKNIYCSKNSNDNL